MGFVKCIQGKLLHLIPDGFSRCLGNAIMEAPRNQSLALLLGFLIAVEEGLLLGIHDGLLLLTHPVIVITEAFYLLLLGLMYLPIRFKRYD